MTIEQTRQYAKVDEVNNGLVNYDVVQFESLSNFWKFINESTENATFAGKKTLASKDKSMMRTDFTGTKSFEEAVDLFKNGWSEMAAKMNQMLNVKRQTSANVMQQRNKLSVEGYQAVVPMYLNNQPNAMFARKMVPIKQKVVTLTKNISYSCQVTQATILEESVKALRIVEKIESTGVRCNLDIIWGSEAGGYKNIVKIRIKSSSEKLNVSKMAFPLVHPSMLRRLIFRYIEVYAKFNKQFEFGYGMPITDAGMKSYMSKDEYLLPAFITADVDKIKCVDDLSKPLK